MRVNTNKKIHEAFNVRSQGIVNDNIFEPKVGINDADRIAFWDNYDRARVLRIQEIKRNNY